MTMADLPREPTAEMLDDMRHATAWPKNHRNYFAAEPTTQAPLWDQMVEMGLASRGRTINEPPNELYIYHVTEAGKAALRKETDQP